MKPKSQYKDESRWVIVLWEMIKKGLLHNYHSEYCNGKIYREVEDDCEE